ncbi:flagellar biosynthetic protein FliO [Heliorestis convoluta]|uniref:Flagellar biosynthesis, FliO family protein n=1 Tax=Heliorestis convoluta TaxID=356322 RepID=A0A5Q2N4E9_9FIRM|nr:flagellar biosynthetic protein FliO [Heliorestis convoluta]QGG48182.1 flagellar biosynthesis, FliO family protein [Heliorestis convoluta]
MNVYGHSGRRIVGGLVFFFVLLFVLINPLSALASSEVESGTMQERLYPSSMTFEDRSESMPGTGEVVFRLIITLSILAIVAGIVLRYVKGTRKAFLPKGEWLAVHDQVSLGPNKNLYITEIAGKYVVLAVTDQSIQPIMEINDPNKIESIRRSLEERQEPKIPNLISDIRNFAAKTKREEESKKELSFHSEMIRQINRLNSLQMGDERQNNHKGSKEGEKM